MLLVYSKILALLSTLSNILSTRNGLQTNISPHCSTRMQCKKACICEKHTNCSLLPIDETTRSSVLYYHNQIRDIQCKGEPQPSGMTMLEYDNDLEAISKCWAGKCSNEHTECFLTTKFNATSQSVAQMILENGDSPGTILWKQMLNFWAKKANSFSIETFKSLPTGKNYEFIHNFAQLMSDRIFSIGCAWSITDNLMTFVCTYGPRGPRTTEKIYSVGKYCTTCPEKYECDNIEPFTRLCKKKFVGNPPTTQNNGGAARKQPNGILHTTTNSSTVYFSPQPTYKKILQPPLGRRRKKPIANNLFHPPISLYTTANPYAEPQSTAFDNTNVKIDKPLQNEHESPPQMTLITPHLPPIRNSNPQLSDTSILVDQPLSQLTVESTSVYFPKYNTPVTFLSEIFPFNIPPYSQPPSRSFFQGPSETTYQFPSQSSVEFFTPKTYQTTPYPIFQTAQRSPKVPYLTSDITKTISSSFLKTHKFWRKMPPIESWYTSPLYSTPAPNSPTQILHHTEYNIADHSKQRISDRTTEISTHEIKYLQSSETSYSTPTLQTPPVLPKVPGATMCCTEKTEINVTEENITDVLDSGKHREAEQTDSDTEPDDGNSRMNLIIFLSVGAVFLIVGAALFMLVMYTLRMTLIRV